MGLDYDGAGLVWLEAPLPVEAFVAGLSANRWCLMSPDLAEALTPGARLPVEKELELQEGFHLIPATAGERVQGIAWSGDLYWTTILDTLDEFAACAPGAQATVIGYINALGAELYSSHVFYDAERGFERTDEHTAPLGKTWVYEPRPHTAVLRAPAPPEPTGPAAPTTRCQRRPAECTAKPRWKVRRRGAGADAWQHACSRHLAQICSGFPKVTELDLVQLTI